MIERIESIGSASPLKHATKVVEHPISTANVDPAAVSAFEEGLKGVRATAPTEGPVNERVMLDAVPGVRSAEASGFITSHVDEIREEMNELIRSSLSGLNSSDPVARMTAEMTKSGLLTVQLSALTTVTQNLTSGVQTLLKQQT